jgi:peptide/nickel transport system ATP-binding protein
MILLSAENVRAYYFLPQGVVKAVDGINLSLEKGITLGLAGESGCGKSTLVNTLLGSIKPPLRLLEGKILLDGKEISKMNISKLKKDVWGVEVSLVPQSALNALMPTKKVIDFIKDALVQHKKFSDSEILSLAKKRFEELNLDVKALYMFPHELSGGMRQRVVIAISTLLNPKLLIVDEPTSALDVSSQKQVLRTLLDLKKSGIIQSMIFVTHDIAVLRQIADKIGIMYAGKLVELSSTDNVLYNPKHPYTVGLINAIVTPEPEVKRRKIVSIPGQPPNLLNPPSGCRFHTRCKFAMDICLHKEPPLLEVEGDTLVACHLFSSSKGG